MDKLPNQMTPEQRLVIEMEDRIAVLETEIFEQMPEILRDFGLSDQIAAECEKRWDIPANLIMGRFIADDANDFSTAELVEQAMLDTHIPRLERARARAEG